MTINRVGFLGGVERVIVSCGLAAQAYGLRPILACPNRGELAREAGRRGIDVVEVDINRSKAARSPSTWLRLLLALWVGQRQIAALCRERGVGLLHTHHPISALYALYAARRLRVPLLLHVHETLPVHTLYRSVMKLVLPHCTAVTCVSDQSRAMVLALGAAPARVKLIYNGVDPDFLGSIAPVAELARSGPHIGLFGVLEPRKGQDLFIQAARQVADRHSGAQFWLVGDLSFSENAGYVAALRGAIEAAKLTNRVHLTGFRRDVRDWMAGMDAVVLASRGRESLPTVLIESALLGRPLVATDVGGVREIIEDGVSGLVVPPGDANHLAKGILRALGPEGAGFGATACARAEQRFSFERFRAELAAQYQQLLSVEA